MPLPAGALSVYCNTIFDTGSRTLSQFLPATQEEIKVHAVQVKKYALSVYDATLAAGRITQEQYDELIAMSNFPSSSLEEPRTTTEEENTEATDV